MPPPSKLLRQAWAIDKPLTMAGAGFAAVLLVATVGMVVDPTVITGAPAWLKPAKFAISFGAYSCTFLWLLTFVTGHQRLVHTIGLVTALAGIVELVIIAGAAALGTTSHFNNSTTAHSIIWGVMAFVVILAWIANLVLGVLLLRQRLADRGLAWSLRLGVFISALGMVQAYFMTLPTPEQLSAAGDEGDMPIMGAHSVGAPDDGPGLPVVGWSTIGGDMRIGHFLGLHALQVLPIIGILLAKFGPSWLRQSDRVGLIGTAGLSYFGIFLLSTWQAMRGQPLVKPDALTLGVLAAIVLAATAATATILARARARARAHQADIEVYRHKVGAA